MVILMILIITMVLQIVILYIYIYIYIWKACVSRWRASTWEGALVLRGTKGIPRKDTTKLLDTTSGTCLSK